MTRTVWQGGCNCGSVRIELQGQPIRTGLCHCLICRRETGGPFMAFATWDAVNMAVTGETKSWTATTDHRHFCPTCGSSLFGTHDKDGEVEVRLGVLDEAPSGLAPAYELWTPRREHWQRPVDDAVQHSGNRT